MAKMKWLLLFGVVLLLNATHTRAISIFPEIKDTRVAGTTNREVARGLATDGTNFLVVFQGDNLYPATESTNQLAAQLLGPTGALIGSRIDLALSGGVPLVEFGASNFLVTWMNNTAGVPGVHGQFLNHLGNPSGPSFVIATNTLAPEVGAMTFAMGYFWIVWAQTNVSSPARIMLQRVSESGVGVGEAIALGSTNSADQRFPALSASSTNVLVTWIAHRPDTNAWDVLGCFLDATGNASSEIVVNQFPSVQPYPVAAASDGTNHLVVWSQEAGTNRIFFHGYAPVTNERIFVTNQLPRVFGRLLIGNTVSAPEIPISYARWGQVSVSVAFDGTNYLVGWNDRRYADFQNDYSLPDGKKAWYLPAFTNQVLFYCFIDRAGSPVDWEFLGDRHVSLQGVEGEAPLNTGPVIRFGKNSGAVLRNRRSAIGGTNDVFVTSLVSPPPSHGEIKLLGINSDLSGRVQHEPPFVQVQIESTNSHFIPQWSSNAVDWVTPKPSSGHPCPPYDYQLTDFIDTDGSTTRFTLRLHSNAGFFRAFEDKYVCKSNLRRIARQKEMWAYAGDFFGNDTPSDHDVWPSCADKPECPTGGHDLFIKGKVNELPRCIVLFHELP